MSYRVQIERDATKSLASVSPQMQRRLARRLLALAEDPYSRAVKLEGVDGFRARVGDYRMLYSGHRRSVYR